MKWFICLLLISCSAKIPPVIRIEDFKCSVEQIKRVEKETEFCNKNTSYFGSYCYSSAMLRNCDKKDSK